MAYHALIWYYFYF